LQKYNILDLEFLLSKTLFIRYTITGKPNRLLYTGSRVIAQDGGNKDAKSMMYT